MCGIVGAITKQNVASMLLDSLKRLEYRGYDSAGIVVIDANLQFHRHRVLGKVSELQKILDAEPLNGTIGIAHTRWATHGIPNERNAHPHIAGDEIALVHNGIIENHESIRSQLNAEGCKFDSDTDSELVAHLIYLQIKAGDDFVSAVRHATAMLEGAWAMVILHRNEPQHMIAVRRGSPLVIGVSNQGNYIASDHLALLPLTQEFIYLEQDDLADIYDDHVKIYDMNGDEVKRSIHHASASPGEASKGNYQHFMLKEIHEQSTAVLNTLEGCISDKHVNEESFGKDAHDIFSKTEHVQIIACGTSYHAGLVARLWMEEIANIPCQVEIASENRYRRHTVPTNSLCVIISQSGETADSLAALQLAKKSGYLAILAICNVPDSSIARDADLVFITNAGPEISVASTKAFTTQLTALILLTIAIGRCHGMNEALENDLIRQLRTLPSKLDETLLLDASILKLAEQLMKKNNVFYIGRGMQLPIAMEGALKLKEISYIHAEACAAGELKHGPIALIDDEMITIVLAPADELLDKLKSNIEEIRARNGSLIIFTHKDSGIKTTDKIHVIELPAAQRLWTPFIYAIAMQLLAYHVAVLRKTDVDQPRNLAKSVTVE